MQLKKKRPVMQSETFSASSHTWRIWIHFYCCRTYIIAFQYRLSALLFRAIGCCPGFTRKLSSTPAWGPSDTKLFVLSFWTYKNLRILRWILICSGRASSEKCEKCLLSSFSILQRIPTWKQNHLRPNCLPIEKDYSINAIFRKCIIVETAWSFETDVEPS